MAAPVEITSLDLSGTWVMNKTLSDSTERLLTLQGVGWMTRKTIAYATITLSINHFKEESGAERIKIAQTLTGGITGTTENRILTWTDTNNEDHIFGAVISKSRRAKLEDIEGDYLRKDWSADTLEHGLIQTRAESDTAKSGTSWIAEQTWGFQDIKGERRYTRHVKFTGPKAEDLELILVYDYIGPRTPNSDA